MPTQDVVLNRALIVNDEANDTQGQLSAGEEALDGDGNAVLVLVRMARAPASTDIKPAGQHWLNTTNNVLYYSRGAGLWYQVGIATSVAAHQATHRAGGSDPLPWTTIHGKGLLSARPAVATSNAGYYYEATDTGQIFRSTGTAWEEFAVTKNSSIYTHTQATASAAWSVAHNLGRRPPSISVLDSAGSICLFECQHIDTNNLVLRFGYAFSGTAIMR
jgi:hypothetical protein